MSYFNERTIKKAKLHALECYPEESCGVVANGAYQPCVNRAEDPATAHVEGNDDCPCRLCRFVIAPEDQLKYKKITGIIHSHPGGPLSPSAADMVGQVSSDVPWGIIPVDVEHAGEIIEFGDMLPVAPLIGRKFVHGVTDCYALIRDVYRAGKDELLQLGVIDGEYTTWPYEPILLEDVPRSDGWWKKDGEDLYGSLFQSRGFRAIDASEVRAGDVFLAKIECDRYNHGGVSIGGGLILDHRPGRISAREPLNIWARTTAMWLRFGSEQE